MSKISFDYARGEMLMEQLLCAYHERRGVVRFRPETHAPQNLFVPYGIEPGSLRWRQWMARAAGTDRRSVSMHHYAKHVSLYVMQPTLYTYRAADLSAAEVERMLRSVGMSMPGQSAKYLPVIAGTLFTEFDDDPLNLYTGGTVSSVLEFRARFKKERGYQPLPGFGPKISSLLALYFEEKKLTVVPDAFPADLHVQRIFLSTRAIVLNEPVENDVLENELRLFLCDLCARENLDRIALAHALRFLGNQGCSFCPGNAAMEIACPLYAECGGRAASLAYFRKGLWDPNVPPYRKGGDRTFRLAPVDPQSVQRGLFEEKK